MPETSNTCTQSTAKVTDHPANHLDDRVTGRPRNPPSTTRRQQIIKTHTNKLKKSSGTSARRLQGATL
jgi:hypothetical protein